MKILNINTTPGYLSISNPKADMQMERTQAKVYMNTQHARVEIDQQQCFNETGLKDYKTLNAEFAASGAQAALQATERIADEGNMMADIQNGGNAISEIGYGNSFSELDYNIDVAPKSRPKVYVTEGHVDIRVEDGQLRIESNVVPIQINYQRGKVDISV